MLTRPRRAAAKSTRQAEGILIGLSWAGIRPEVQVGASEASVSSLGDLPWRPIRKSHHRDGGDELSFVMIIIFLSRSLVMEGRNILHARLDVAT